MGQYAGLYSLAKKTGQELVILREAMDIHRKVKIFEAFAKLKARIIPKAEIAPVSIYNVKNQLMDPDVYAIDPKLNWDVRGAFHTYQYWHENRDELLQEFQFKPEIVEKAKAFLAPITLPTISMHFRRTDYLQVSSLNLGPKYYYDAYEIVLHKLCQNVILLVFSDDIEWCKKNVTGENIIYSEGHTQYEDMCIMSLCKHNIIANSTFSWWGAYLNQNPDKIVVCPYQYTGPGDYDFINGNYFPPEWNSIKV
jgi:hypothetical protein